MLVGLSPFFLWAGKQKYSWCLLCAGQKKLHPFGKLLFVCTSVCVSSPWNDLSSAQKWQKFGPWNLEWSIASVTHTQAVVWRRKWQPPPVLLPGESHGQRCLAAYNPWGLKESDTTERLTHTHTHTHTHCFCVPQLSEMFYLIVPFKTEEWMMYHTLFTSPAVYWSSVPGGLRITETDEPQSLLLPGPLDWGTQGLWNIDALAWGHQ